MKHEKAISFDLDQYCKLLSPTEGEFAYATMHLPVFIEPKTNNLFLEDQAFHDLAARKIGGVSGVSVSIQNAQKWFAFRDLLLVMPLKELFELNETIRCTYADPDQLVKDNLSVFFTLYGKETDYTNPADYEYVLGQILSKLGENIETDPEEKNPEKRKDLCEVIHYTNPAFEKDLKNKIARNKVVFSSVSEFCELILSTLFEDILYRTTPLEASDIEVAMCKALVQSARTLTNENEWIIDQEFLAIPDSCRLFFKISSTIAHENRELILQKIGESETEFPYEFFFVRSDDVETLDKIHPGPMLVADEGEIHPEGMKLSFCTDLFARITQGLQEYLEEFTSEFYSSDHYLYYNPRGEKGPYSAFRVFEYKEGGLEPAHITLHIGQNEYEYEFISELKRINMLPMDIDFNEVKIAGDPAELLFVSNGETAVCELHNTKEEVEYARVYKPLWSTEDVWDLLMKTRDFVLEHIQLYFVSKDHKEINRYVFSMFKSGLCREFNERFTKGMKEEFMRDSYLSSGKERIPLQGFLSLFSEYFALLDIDKYRNEYKLRMGKMHVVTYPNAKNKLENNGISLSSFEENWTILAFLYNTFPQGLFHVDDLVNMGFNPAVGKVSASSWVVGDFELFRMNYLDPRLTVKKIAQNKAS